MMGIHPITMWHKKFIPVAILVTMLASMGESLHALPGMDHDTVVSCDASNTHVDALQDQAGQDCFLCQHVTNFQAIQFPQPMIRPDSLVEHLVDSISSNPTQAFFYIYLNRGPPTA